MDQVTWFVSEYFMLVYPVQMKLTQKPWEYTRLGYNRSWLTDRRPLTHRSKSLFYTTLISLSPNFCFLLLNKGSSADRSWLFKCEHMIGWPLKFELTSSVNSVIQGFDWIQVSHVVFIFQIITICQPRALIESIFVHIWHIKSVKNNFE